MFGSANARFTVGERRVHGPWEKGYIGLDLHISAMNLLIADKDAHVPEDQANPERRELVNRIIASSTFAKSSRLCSFLKYICDLTFQGRTQEINEQQIGTAVFGRRPHFDSSIDGIVRAQASRLRNRLEIYFEEEGRTEPTRIVIPRGSYVPHFIPQGEAHFTPDSPGTSPTSPEAESLDEIEPTAPASVQPTNHRWKWFVVASLVLLLLLTIPTLVIVARRSGPGVGVVPLNPLWQQLFLKNHPTFLIYADSSLVLYQGAVRRNLGLAEYLKGDYRVEESSKIGSTSLTTSTLS